MRSVQELSTFIKEHISSNFSQFKDELDLAVYIEQMILKEGYICVFPVNILVDKVVSNTTPLKSTPLAYKVCTIDFGIKDKQNKIIDTAFTLASDPYRELLDLYRGTMRLIESELAELCDLKPLTIEDVTLCVSKHFKKIDSKLRVIPYCGAHTVETNQLHGTFIPMCEKLLDSLSVEEKTRPLTSRFTIEPHCVVVSPEKLVFKDLKPTIVVDTFHNFDTVDQRLKNLKGPVVRTYSGLWSSRLSFYEEQTYLVKDKQLMKLS